MLKISKNKISITRGDSAYIEIGITKENEGIEETYVLNEGDDVRLQVRTMANTGDLLIDASLDNGKIYVDGDTLMWHIVPDDTKSLAIGKYSYDVEIVTSAGDVYTFIEDSPFVVTNEVTRYD